MDFFMAFFGTVIVSCILFLVIGGLIASNPNRKLASGAALLGQIAIFWIGLSGTALVILLALNLLIPASDGNSFWNHLAGGTCIMLVLMGFGLALCGGFAALDGARKIAQVMKRKAE